MSGENLTVDLWYESPVEILRSKVMGHLKFFVDKLQEFEGWRILRHTMVQLPQEGSVTYTLSLSLMRVEDTAISVLEMRVAIDKLRNDKRKFKHFCYKWNQAPTASEIASLERGKDDLLDYEDFDPASILAPHEIYIPPNLLQFNNRIIEHHAAFKGIYGRTPHIRRLLHAINSFQNSAAFSVANPTKKIDLTRNHVLLYGPPSGGKSRILGGLKRLLEKGTYFELDAPSATKAGIVKLFRKTFRDHCPPIIIVEEIEKVDVNGLIGWLQLLDERAELSKFTHFTQDKIKTPFLCIAACNDKGYLERILKGSFSSRFGHQIYVPRPNVVEMKSILKDRIKEIGGNPKWVDVCLQWSEEFEINDAREIKGWLDYKEALLDGSAYADIITMRDRQQDNVVDAELSDQDIAYQESLKNFHAKGHK